MANRKKAKKAAENGDAGEKVPALTANAFILVKSLKKIQRRTADFLARYHTGDKADVVTGAPPASILAAITTGNDIADHINKMLDDIERDI